MKKFDRYRQYSLSRQLLTGFGISLVTVGLTTLWFNHRLIQLDLERQVQKRAQSIAQSLEFSIEGLLELENTNILRRVVQNYATLPAVVEIAVVNADGLTLAHSSLGLKNSYYTSLRPELAKMIRQASISGIETSSEMVLDGKPVLVQILPFSSVLFGTSGRRGLAIAILNLKQMQQEAWRTFFTSTLITLSGVAVLLLIMGFLIKRNVINQLNYLNEAVIISKATGNFENPSFLSGKEIIFLAGSFETVFKHLEAYERLKIEIAFRQQVEATLRESEARERAKSQQLEQTIQQLQQTQSQLIQSEKMSSLGQLVAGVAHEINNPVGFIQGNLHHAARYSQDLLDLLKLYQIRCPANPEIQFKIEEIDLDFLQEDLPKVLSSMQVGTDRINKIVQSLRSFSHLDESEIKQIDIHKGIDSTLMILQHRLRAKLGHPEIQVIKQYGNLPKIECYASQLNQVVMNILNNAIDAIEEHYLNLSSAQIEVNPGAVAIATQLLETDRVEIRIADNAGGIPEAIQSRIFEPFFTTKPVGKGTGLGMSIGHQIVVKHGGTLRCISVPGRGTEFVIEIPIRQKRN